jgi:hypothetical protein
LRVLIESDFGEIDAKLNVLPGAMTAVSAKIDSLAGLTMALNAHGEALSEQSVWILRRFASSSDTRMIFMGRHLVIAFLPSNQVKGLPDPRFAEDDISALEQLGFISHVDQNGSGDPVYALTRAGANAAAAFTG